MYTVCVLGLCVTLLPHSWIPVPAVPSPVQHPLPVPRAGAARGPELCLCLWDGPAGDVPEAGPHSLMDCTISWEAPSRGPGVTTGFVWNWLVIKICI